MDIFVPNKLSIQAVDIPPSKSFAQRAILAAALCSGETIVKNIGTSDDVLHILDIAKQLGATTNIQTNDVHIFGKKNPVKKLLNCGESGLGIRLTTSISACFGGDFELTGSGSLLKRPMDEFDRLIPQLGIDIQTNNGHLPITLSGEAHGGEIKIDGSLSSQYLSGLLMGLPLLRETSTIHVNQLNSKPYIDITLCVLNDFGISVSNLNYEQFKITAEQKYVSPSVYTTEGDYSGASMWMVFGAIRNEIKIKGLKADSVQADKKMLDALILAGVQFNWNNSILEIKPGTIEAFDFNATDCPDLFPALVVLAAAAKGTTSIKGLNRLAHKESDRGIVLQKEFKKLGLEIELNNDTMLIHGNGKLNSGTIDANNDHRIAMAGGIASQLTINGINITNAEAVAKSYPNFWEDLTVL